jgi:hypothetical protein
VISTGDLKRGISFEMDGDLFRLREFNHIKMERGRAQVRMKLDRDRNGGDRGGPRVVLLAGRVDRGDRPARHEHADRRGRTKPHRGAAPLPREAPARITLLDNVQLVAHTALMQEEKVYRNSMIPVGNTGGLQVRATSLNLLSVLSTGVARGDRLNEGTAREPVAVLGSVAAEQLGSDRVYPDQRIWLGGQWFSIAGIPEPAPLEPDIDDSAFTMPTPGLLRLK